jgi:ubiquinone biosynthesis protein UbiJ
MDHLEARVSDKTLDQNTLAVAVADLINVVSMLEKEVRRLDERLDRLERER